MPDEKKVVWIGTSLDDLRDFPKDARHDAGFQLEQVQLGLEPDDWKPIPAVGAGCREIRIRTADGAFRVFYVTKSVMRCSSCTASRRSPNRPPRET